MQRYSFDIKDMLTNGIVAKLSERINALVAESATVRQQQVAALTKMRGQIEQDFVAALAAGRQPRKQPRG